MVLLAHTVILGLYLIAVWLVARAAFRSALKQGRTGILVNRRLALLLGAPGARVSPVRLAVLRTGALLVGVSFAVALAAGTDPVRANGLAALAGCLGLPATAWASERAASARACRALSDNQDQV